MTEQGEEHRSLMTEQGEEHRSLMIEQGEEQERDQNKDQSSSCETSSVD